jgi:hypothetical protein
MKKPRREALPRRGSGVNMHWLAKGQGSEISTKQPVANSYKSHQIVCNVFGIEANQPVPQRAAICQKALRDIEVTFARLAPHDTDSDFAHPPNMARKALPSATGLPDEDFGRAV